MRMRFLSAVIVAIVLTASVAAEGASLSVPQPIDIPQTTGTLHALLYKPDGDGPFPTVIALHGCDGLAAHPEAILPRYRDWAEQLLKAGNAVLLPDSYGSRELGPQCRINVKERRVHARRERVADILAARQWLLHQPWVSPDRISLVGWANGAIAVLWAVRPQLPVKADPDFRSAVAFYPDCRLPSGLGWSARIPTLVLIGGNDDQSPPAACRQMIDGARGRSALARIVVYPGAYHDFDRPNLPLNAASGNTDASAHERGHQGADPEAREDSQKRVAEWLAR
jgi:dienelactone hydrolase